MKRSVGLSMTMVFCLGMGLWAGPARASCPSGKAGNMQSEPFMDSFEAFGWQPAVQTDLPEKVRLDFASMPMDDSTLQFTDNGMNFVQIGFSTLVFDGIPYYSDQWNNFKVFLNFNNDTFRSSVNGELSPSKPFGSAGDEVDMFSFTYFGSSPESGWIDTVRLITESEIRPKLFSPRTFRTTRPPRRTTAVLQTRLR